MQSFKQQLHDNFLKHAGCFRSFLLLLLNSDSSQYHLSVHKRMIYHKQGKIHWAKLSQF